MAVWQKFDWAPHNLPVLLQMVEVQTKNAQVYLCIFDAAKNESNNMGEVISITTTFLVAKGIE
jgi:hypothetical protein